MKRESALVLEELRSQLRPASVAQVGGFRPGADPLTSWFLKGVCLPGEGLPVWKGQPMFPLLQIRTDELPVIPEQLKGIALLVLFHNREHHPFDQPHGEGWLIREYATLEGLELLPELETPYRPFPVRWVSVNDDAPGWEDAWDIIDLSEVNDDTQASDSFFDDFNRYGGTKVGGYPMEIQHGVGIEDFVFQVGSEEKVNWMWADNGIGYFHRSAEGIWQFSCQFY
ncbi:YwqG family protein [Leclercia sp. H6W5]|uniref:YwqG family protein n=1 Tax=Leclercia tamurae TaxID=2926467 RepID=UPI0021D284E1|nr:YwqG family protein [Leclercia tamurae]MCU6684134.1 YwqG family protein [Leclercia tamurae]